MKLLPALLLVSTPLFSQTTWSPTQQVTSDSVDSFDHSFVEDLRPTYGKEREILTYVQGTGNSAEIMLRETERGGLNWLSTPTRMTNDIVPDGHPVISQLRSNNGKFQKMLVWERGDNDIYYSFTPDSIWSTPALLATGIYGGKQPYISCIDSIFGAVWVNQGRILLSEYKNNSWLQPLFINPPNDTLNFNPQIKYFPKPMIIWERQKFATTDRAIVFVTRNDTGWTAPDTITTLGDNRNPRFVKLMYYLSLVSFESNRSGSYRIFGVSRSSSGGLWDSPTPISSNGVDASFVLIPVITSLRVNAFFQFTAGTWRMSPNGVDSIALAAWTANNLSFRRAGAENRNPRIATGVPGDYTRVWSVWETTTNGRRTLFGSSVNINTGGVDELARPASFSLYQNYPNPFNPSTTISFELARPSHVTLKIFDVLGREVISLLDERKDSGYHRVEIKPPSLSTGVYFYRLSVDGYEKVRKMLFLK